MAPPWYLLLLVALVGALNCPDGSTCGDHMTCCSLPGGDGYGCCPQGAAHSLPMITDVSCTEQMGCPEEYSCVKTPSGGSACCPLAQGTSCQDGHHCCPSGTHCSEDGHSCLPGSRQSAIICPDGASECPSDTTCCQMSDQSWGCCPLEQATCCSDHVHCCPHKSVCDLVHGTCVSGDTSVPMSTKVPARVRLQDSVTVRRTTCKDNSSCPDGSTCCELGDRSFGCCPLISAVCCGDHLHCCPSGTSCDLSHNKCVSKDAETPMLAKIPALREEATVKCDDQSSCPDSSTCCRLASGEWGCCPYEEAVCCPDKIHCCPNGYTCSGDSCEEGKKSIPWVEKTPALKSKGDGHIISGTENSIPWMEKTPALKNKATVKCDDQSSCPDSTTCCRLASGEWGCCPYEEAVCCPDKIHCCPNGYTCSGDSCEQGQDSIAWLEKIPAMKTKSSDVPCGDTTYCPDKNTCCRLPSGNWGCCPIEKAVCCTDHLHCCPSGYTCDVGTGQCNKPAPDEPAASVKSVGYVWCDGSHACYDGQTCCIGPGGVWSCCPYPHGVCCPDRLHCCPYGHVCLNQGAQCSRSEDLRWDLGWVKRGRPTL